ncbi:P-loop containing nucleoside triphosphate hydrolase protein [Rhizoclosmatium globosum]|uniref:p-loop containing nucleoside triphosphate hydrolase protein n=1 Tax=Rhizoclosmatium globosum TaxID=329046 RepID=A0A1Y2CM84_9FUNG|nr:P-loop containing nucleoside triphosphate hydrolase protein [Rhizoclosmatium globosum]|eukprot:ORY48141.1 P-loop containing nucleoside triphosphate hydrolase protein [Rhizoclosmatium globosum]
MTQPTTVRMDPWSFISFAWMTSVVFKSTKKELDATDLPTLRPQDLSAVTPDWPQHFLDKHKEYEQTKVGKPPTLFGALVDQARPLWYISGFLYLINIACLVGIPLVLQQVIDLAGFYAAVMKQNIPGLWEIVPIQPEFFKGFPLFTKSAWSLAFLILGLKVASSIFGRAKDFILKRVAFNIRTVLINAVVKKSLTISSAKANEFSKGYVLNLINVDSESVSIFAEQVHELWALPLQLVVAIALLAVMLGSSIGAGVGALLASMMLLGVTVPVFIIASLPKMLVANDTRVKLIREALDGIRLIKIRSLGPSFESQINRVRLEQLHWLKRFLYGVVSFVVIGQLANFLPQVSAFTLYAVRNGSDKADASIIFPAASLFQILVNPLIQLPQTLNAMISAMASWNRIYNFLVAPDREIVPDNAPDNLAISMESATFNWPSQVNETQTEKPAPKKRRKVKRGKKAKNVTDEVELEEKVPKKLEVVTSSPRSVLVNLDLKIEKGKFVAIVGAVGSGKSSLLSAILGDLEMSSGQIAANGSIAYCTQQAWIQTGTVEENVLFGNPLNQEKLDLAVTCTCLQSDLANMPSGIKTVLGEKGTSVSGGQKTRIALARAVYSEADIYLLDDPLSSLDARVSRAVFNDCFKTALKGKTILLATHNHDVLKETDHIIFIRESGEISQGTHDELMKLKEFSEFVTTVDDTKTGLVPKVAPTKDASIHTSSNSADPSSIIADEEREIGNVKAATYMAYVRACGGWVTIIALVTVIILKESAALISNQWLTWWSDNILLGQSHDVYFWTGWYNALVWIAIFFLVVLNFIVHAAIMRSTRVFHESAVSGVMNAPIWWFESQQIGRIMNRFTKDMAAIDQRLLPQVFQLIAGVGTLFSIVIILAINSPWLLIGVVPLAGMYMFVLRYYRSAMRQLKRLESVQRSPLYSHVSESLEGVSTILAYKKQAFFSKTTNTLLDFSNSPLFYKIGAELWVILRLELLSAILVFILASQCTNSSFISPSSIGVALMYTNALTAIMNLVLQSAANMETEMVCVERLVEYSERLPVEGARRLANDPSETSWPKSGSIEFKGVSAYYKSKPETPVLKAVSLAINAGEKICIVGRTGSGKSTLISVLMRFVDKKGDVCIDGREIESVGFQTLREAMEVIPQDIYLFSGTLRTTLDRNSVFSDEQLWSSLESVGMKKFVANLEQKLDTPIENGGSNLSLGQRQLLYFARMLLLKPKIILMDEATSSVDPETETTLRQVIKEQFVGTTIIAVLHRLQTSVLEDFDKVLVMDAGNVAEFDAPRVLLKQEGSIFASLYTAHSSF